MIQTALNRQRGLRFQEALGSHLYEWFVRANSLEWEEYRCQVTPLELRDLLIY